MWVYCGSSFALPLLFGVYSCVHKHSGFLCRATGEGHFLYTYTYHGIALSEGGTVSLCFLKYV
jgi:hypothetical protein